VHGDRLLLNKAYPDKFRKALTASVRARGTKLVLNDFVDTLPAQGESVVTTRRGTTLKADLVVRI
jgi:glycine/D-amino acid oxidase-like deaminating enzyme